MYKNKEDHKKYMKEWAKKNRDRLRRYREEYSLKNKDKQKKYMEEYNLKNKDKIKKDQKEYNLKNKDKIKIQAKEYRRNNKNRIKERKWKAIGIILSYEDFIILYKEQNGKCNICNQDIDISKAIGKNQAAHVDHDHITGEIRGLLCNNCNRALGYFKDSEVITGIATEYLKFYRNRSIGLFLDTQFQPSNECDQDLYLLSLLGYTHFQ